MGNRPAFEPALDVLLLMIDPWLMGREDELHDRLLRFPEIDWDSVMAHAARHRVTPFLARRCAQVVPGLPARIAPRPATGAALRQEVQRALVAEMAMLGEIRRLGRHFAEQDIPVLLLKGLALSMRCYGSLGQRINHDIDLVVEPDCLIDADRVMQAAGYRRVEPPQNASASQLAASIDRSKDWVYRGGQGLIVELHHRLFDNQTICRPAVAARKREVNLFGQVRVDTLGPADELPYLALHGALHAWSRLKWLLDFGLLLRTAPNVELDALLRAERGGPAWFYN